MNLWIRSQDKKKLIKVNEIKIESVIDGNSFIYSDITDLGNYKTKERALEILNEIQKLLEDETIETEITYIDNQEYERIVTKKPNIPKDKVVYEMPKE